MRNVIMATLLVTCFGSMTRGEVAISHIVPGVVRREVESDFSSALAQNPRDAALRAAYARWLSKEDRFQEAEMEQRAAVETKPDDPVLREEFAQLLALRDEREAEQQFQEGLRRTPTSALLRSSYARFLVVRRGEEKKALSEYEQGSQLANPKEDPGAFSEMLAQYGTLITRAQGRGRSALSRAERQFVRAAEEHPSAPAHHHYASFLRFDKKDYRAAEKEYETALELDPEFPNALCGFASLLDAIRGQYDRAEELYERAETSGRCLAPYAQFLRRVRKDYVRMTELVTSKAAEDMKPQPDFENARIWHGLHVEGALEGGVMKCMRVGADAVRVLACFLLYFAQYLHGYLHGLF